MKIMFVITSLGVGGAESQVVALAENLHKRGFGVFVVCMIPLGANAVNLRSLGIDVASLNMVPGKASVKALREFYLLVKKWEPDVIHSHMFHANLFARISKIIYSKIPLISTAHSINECNGGFVRYWAYRLTRDISCFNTNVSQAAFKRYCDIKLIDPSKGDCILNGIDFKKFEKISKENLQDNQAFSWIAVGRLVLAKDYPNLLRAIVILKKDFPHILVRIAGDGCLEFDLNQLIKNYGIEKNVKLLGSRDDIPALLASSSAFVMSSSWEGLPMALLEAVAAGLPAVVTDVGGNREVIEIARNGLCIPSQDPEILATAMRSIMEMDEQKRKSLGENGAIYIKNKFDINSVVDKWLEVYSRFL